MEIYDYMLKLFTE